MSIYYGYRRYYNTREDAYSTLNAMKDIAHTYGKCTVMDLMRLYNRGRSLNDTKRGWTVDDLKKAHICRSDMSTYFINLPEPTWFESPADSLENSKPTLPAPDILNITIHTNEFDVHDPDEIISDVFKHIVNIKDRMINITIM